MTALDTKFRKLAQDLINKNGKLLPIKFIVNGTYNPETSEVMDRVETTVSVKMIVEDYDLHDSGAGFASGLIISGDKNFSIAAADLSQKPKSGDVITMDSKAWTIERVKETWSGEEICKYDCQARS